MKKSNVYDKVQSSFLYQRNMKIQKNLWKPYAIALIIGVMVILVKGIN
jgi:hypothetical protein